MKIRLHENFTSEIFYQQKYPDLQYVSLLLVHVHMYKYMYFAIPQHYIDAS